jgi:hypothetical protein
MKLALTLGAAVFAASIAAAPVTLAQTTEPNTNNGGQIGEQEFGQPRSGPQDREHGEMMGRGMAGERMMHRMHREMMEGRGEYRHMDMGGRSAQQGASFRFRRGDAVINIRCPKDEELSACVQGAIRLIREVKGLESTSGSTTPSVNPSGAAAPPSPTNPQD